MVSSLKQAKAEQADVDALNAAFRNYRTATLPAELTSAADSFKQTLDLDGIIDSVVEDQRS